MSDTKMMPSIDDEDAIKTVIISADDGGEIGETIIVDERSNDGTHEVVCVNPTVNYINKTNLVGWLSHTTINGVTHVNTVWAGLMASFMTLRSGRSGVGRPVWGNLRWVWRELRSHPERIVAIMVVAIGMGVSSYVLASPRGLDVVRGPTTYVTQFRWKGTGRDNGKLRSHSNDGPGGGYKGTGGGRATPMATPSPTSSSGPPRDHLGGGPGHQGGSSPGSTPSSTPSATPTPSHTPSTSPEPTPRPTVTAGGGSGHDGGGGGGTHPTSTPTTRSSTSATATSTALATSSATSSASSTATTATSAHAG